MTTTPTYNFELIDFDKSPWHLKEHDNWRMIDAILANFIPSSSVQGVWSNSLAVTVGQRYVDPDIGSIWSALVAHTTATSGTFATDRAANTSYWESFTITFSNQGAWAAESSYTVNDFVVDGTAVGAAIGIVLASHTSATSYATGVADGNILTLVDLSDEVAATAADVVTTNADVVLTNADVVSTNADVVSTNADVVTTNADAATTTQDAIDTAADVVSTNADVVSTNADAASTSTNATNSAASAAAASTSETNAGNSETAAAASAASLPTISGGDATRILQVNAGEDGYDFVAAPVLSGLDVNGGELVLDADGDTSITADTDDQIDIKVAGADDFQITANTLSVLSGSTLNIDSGATIANSGTATGFGGLASGDVIPADDGSVGAPGLSFADDADNGLYRIGANNFGVAVAGAKAMEFHAIGAVTAPLQPAFNATSTANQASATGDGTTVTVVFGSERYDINSDFDGVSTFTAPVTGKYLFHFSVRTDDTVSGTNDEGATAIVTSNLGYNQVFNYGVLTEGNSGAERIYWRMSVQCDMDAADTATCTIIIKGGTKIVDVRNDNATTFSGMLVV